MANLVRARSYGQTKPPPGAQIDWGHPLAQGLIFAHTRFGRELFSVPPVAVTYSNISVVGPAEDGLSVRGTTDSAAYPASLGDAIWAAPRGFSLFTRYRTDFVSGQALLLTRDSAIGGPHTGSGRFWQWRANAGQVDLITFSNGSTLQAVASSTRTTYNDAQFHNAIGVANYGATSNNVRVVVDGSLQAVASDSGTHTTTNTCNVVSYQNAIAKTDISVNYAWNRPLTLSEATWITADPYAFFAPPGPKVLYFDLGAPPAPTTPTNLFFPFMH